MGAELNFYLFTFDSQSFGLKVRFPDFFGMTLRKAHIVAMLLTFFIKIQAPHKSEVILAKPTDKIKSVYYYYERHHICFADHFAGDFSVDEHPRNDARFDSRLVGR